MDWAGMEEEDLESLDLPEAWVIEPSLEQQLSTARRNVELEVQRFYDSIERETLIEYMVNDHAEFDLIALYLPQVDVLERQLGVCDDAWWATYDIDHDEARLQYWISQGWDITHCPWSRKTYRYSKKYKGALDAHR